jgi:hypothetical protein
LFLKCNCQSCHASNAGNPAYSNHTDDQQIFEQGVGGASEKRMVEEVQQVWEITSISEKQGLGFGRIVHDMFPPSELPCPGQLLLITDELASPADFLLHKFLSTHLKDPKDAKCVVISVSEDLARWKAIASKSVRPMY